MSAPRVTITGGAGFIGSHTALRFARDGYAVRVLDDFSSGSRDNCDPTWEVIEGDVRDAHALGDAVAGSDAVVHLAAFTSVPESFERFAECYHTNVTGTYHVLEACLRAGVRRLVFASSSAVYAEHPDAPKLESDCPGPISPYAVSKLEGEHLLAAFAERHGLRATALRFFNVYGPRQPADSAYAAAVPIFMERGLAGQACTVYGDGSQTRDFVHVQDVAGAIVQAARSTVSGVYNVGTGEAVSVLTLADTIAELTGGPREHRFEPLRAGDVRSSTAGVGRAAAELGWRAGCGLAEGLRGTLAWYAERVAG